MDQLEHPTAAFHNLETTASMTVSFKLAAAAPSIRTAKRALRKSMVQQLSVVPREDMLIQSTKVSRRILSSPTYKAARAVSIYISMGAGEVDTDFLCREALREGKRLYVPNFGTVTVATSPALEPPAEAPTAAATTFAADMRMLRITDLYDYQNMKRNRWGIREPLDTMDSGASREDAYNEATGGQGLDVILAPGVAFDCQAGRLGHGKGYYDRYLAQAEAWACDRNQGPGPVCVGLGLMQQVLDEGQQVPADANDRVLDAIITPGGTFRRGDAEKSRWIDGDDN